MWDEFEILVVEDDAAIRERVLVPGLQHQGFANVSGVGTARETYHAMLARQFGAVVLGLHLPDENTFSMARNLRGVTDAAIVLLGGPNASPDDHVNALEEGADAFLMQPVDLTLLAATIRSALRRRGRAQPAGAGVPRNPNDRRTGPAAPLPSGDGWQLLSEGWTLLSPDGQSVRLSHSERLLIGLLFEHRGRIVAREAIAARLSEDRFDFDLHRIEVLVHRLRRKVLKQSGSELPLNAVRGSGYVFTP